MRFKKLMLVTLLLLAILTIGAVSASEDISDIADASQDDTLAVEDAQEDLALNPSEKNIAGDGADDALSYDASDFNVKINESMDLADECPAVTFNVPSDADGEIRVHTNW